MNDLAVVFVVCAGVALLLAPPLIAALQRMAFRQFAYEVLATAERFGWS